MSRQFRRVAGAQIVALGGLLLVASTACAQEREEPDTSEIPAQVMDGLMARFPAAEIDEWTMEEEGEIVVYDIEFNQEGRKFEADIREDGSIHNWEQAIAADDLPAAVETAANARYAGASMTEVMAVTTVTADGEALEGYEIVFRTADDEVAEILVAPDGEILEDEGQGD